MKHFDLGSEIRWKVVWSIPTLFPPQTLSPNVFQLLSVRLIGDDLFDDDGVIKLPSFVTTRVTNKHTFLHVEDVGRQFQTLIWVTSASPHKEGGNCTLYSMAAISSLANGTGKPVGIVGITRTPTLQVPVPQTPQVYLQNKTKIIQNGWEMLKIDSQHAFDHISVNSYPFCMILGLF